MRVKVIGDNSTANTLRGYLAIAKISVVNVLPTFTIIIEESGDRPYIVVDGVDCDLERSIVNHICDKAPGVYLARQNGIRSARAIRVLVPPQEALKVAVEIGCLRGVVDATKYRSRLRAVWAALTS